MTISGRVLSLFPSLLMSLVLGCGIWAGVSGNLLPLFLVPLLVYGLPPILFRIHQRRFPIRLGATRLLGERYVAWWSAHQLQLVFIAIPQLEALLRLVPGLYSAWLRCWGAKIGRSVYWTPLVEISDRSLLVIGDGVVIGHRAGIYGHIIRPTRDNMMLYCKPVVIGAGAFIGAAAVIGPGARVHENAFIEAAARVHPNEEVREKKRTDAEWNP